MLVTALIFVLMLAAGVHIGIALVAASAVHLVFFADLGLNLLPQYFFIFLDKYALTAVPLFVLAGFIMEKSGLLQGLFAFVRNTVGFVPGGLGVSIMFTCVIFAAITGSPVAEVTAMAMIGLPMLRAEGYPDRLSAGILSTGGSLGMLIPPILSLLVYGIVTETSIPKLFIAGVVPGLMLASMLSVLIVYLAWRKGIPRERVDIRNLLPSFTRAIWGLLLPVIVLGGLYGGVFSPTEAGAAAVGYALIYGLIAQRMVFIRGLKETLLGSLKITAMVYFLIGAAGVFSLVATTEQVPQRIAASIAAMGLTPIGFLMLMNLIYLIMGMFLDGISIIVVTSPVVFPTILALGISPIQFGIVQTINCEIGTITPPVGLVLYAMSGVGRIPIQEVLRGAAPFVMMMLVSLVLVTYVPAISTWLPGYMG